MKKQKYRLQKDLTLLTSSFFILVVIWVSFTIYHTHTTSTINNVLQIRIQPITGRFDTAVIDKLKKRNTVNPEFSSPLGTESAQTAAFQITTPEPTETPILTPSSPAPTEIPTPTVEITPTNTLVPSVPVQEITP